jgi:phosphoribosylformylglycinamidine synthase
MILFFEGSTKNIIAVGTSGNLLDKEIEKLIWLFGEAILVTTEKIEGVFVGPR